VNLLLKEAYTSRLKHGVYVHQSSRGITTADHDYLRQLLEHIG